MPAPSLSKTQTIGGQPPKRPEKPRVLSNLGSPAKDTAPSAMPFLQGIIQALLRTLAARDPYTAHHSVRVTEIATLFARHLSLTSQEITSLQKAIILHDIGKIGISDAILNKPGPLTPEERAIISAHPLIGERIVEPLNLTPGEREVILLHHERWDGSGYPRGLAGTAIPLLCRITALVDVYDALISDRPYRRRLTVAEALVEIETQAGRQFDPDLTAAFVSFLKPRCRDFAPGLLFPTHSPLLTE